MAISSGSNGCLVGLFTEHSGIVVVVVIVVVGVIPVVVFGS